MKPKTNKAGDKNKSEKYDRCQTPFYAIDPLLPYLKAEWVVWEPASGDGNIVRKLTTSGLSCFGTDLLSGVNFFEFNPLNYDAIVTNPPYSIKYDWIKRCYELRKPFALLMPLETLGALSGQVLFEQFGLELILMDKRINFKMPDAGYTGSGAQFPTAWFTWGLEIGKEISYAKITRYADEQLSLFGDEQIDAKAAEEAIPQLCLL